MPQFVLLHADRLVRRAFCVALLGLAICAAVAPAKSWAVPTYGFRVVHAYPHDTQAFTEGLFYQGGFLYESTGLEGMSTIRKVDLATGKVLQERGIAPQYFGEGIVAWKNRLIELTWRSEIGFIYDLDSFAPQGSFHYTGEGWALTHDDRHLIMSDGTPTIRLLDPDSLAVVGRIHVTADGAPVTNLNEVEFVKGRIYANIWQTTRIACIDPKTGKVLYWLDLGPLAGADLTNPDAVLNGIAYDAKNDRLFVTGKLWPQLYEIKIVPPAGRKP